MESESDRVTASHYQFFLAYERMLGRNPVEATQNAMRRIGYAIRDSLGIEGNLVRRPVFDPQLVLN